MLQVYVSYSMLHLFIFLSKCTMRAPRFFQERYSTVVHIFSVLGVHRGGGYFKKYKIIEYLSLENRNGIFRKQTKK